MPDFTQRDAFHYCQPIYLIFWTLGIGLINLFGIHLPSCFDALYGCRRFNLQTSKIDERSGKDPWLGAFLSLLFPGLGHAYLRKIPLCIAYIVIYFVIDILPISKQYSFLISPVLQIISSVHAYLIGKKYKVSDINNMIRPWSIIISAKAIFWIIVPLLTSLYIVQWGIYTFGPSMYPTLRNNNGVIIDKITNNFDEPNVGDVVEFKYPVPDKYIKEHPKDKPPIYCKRIVAVGGEKVFVKGNDLYVNGNKRVFEIPDINVTAYDSNEILKNKDNNDFYGNKGCGIGKPFIVPSNCYYVLGDNRSNSLDSRYFGPVPRKLILGKVIKVYRPLRETRLITTKWKEIPVTDDEVLRYFFEK